MIRFACIAAVVHLAAVAASAAPATQPAVLQFPPDAPAVTIAAAPVAGMMCVPVALNGQDCGWMIVDTGTTGTLIDVKLAQKLKLPPVADVTVHPTGAEITTKLVRVDALQIGNADTGSIRANTRFGTVADVNAPLGFSSFKIVGLIGMDVLGDVPTTLDYRAMTVTFHDPAHFIPPPPPAVETELKIITTMPAIRCTLADRLTTWFSIDTGMNTRGQLRGHTYRLLQADVQPKMAVTSFSVGLGGKSEEHEGVFPSLTMFGKQLRDVRLSYFTDVPEHVWLMRLGGTLGVSVFTDQRFTLDVAGGRAWLEPLAAESVAQMVQRLMKQYPDRSGQTPLIAAAGAKRADVVKALIEQGQDVNVHSSVDETALYVASAVGDVESVELLLERKADPNVAVAVGGSTALNLAAERGHEAIVRALLAAGAKPDVANLVGKTPLFSATEAGNLECVRLLLGAKANANYTGKIKFSPLMVAAEKGWLDIAKAMLDAGADMNKPAPALPIAAGAGNVELVRLLLDRGADINATLPDGGTSLMSAAYNGETETVRLLLQRGADPSLRSKAGKTALTYAAENAAGIGPLVRLLIDATATMQPAK